MKKLIINKISKKYNDKEILSDISFSVNNSETVSILGPSGCGKTTLFNIIAGLTAPSSGNILIDEKNITNLSGFISYMPQNDLLLPYKTIKDNVLLPLIIQGQNDKISNNELSFLFNQFLISGSENKYPHELSGGMRQRAAFLRTYMYSKNIMLLDEPFSALDQITKNNMYAWYLSTVEKLNKTTIFITHSIDEALLLSDTIHIISSKSHNIIKSIKVLENKNMNFLFSENFINYKKNIIDILNIT